MAQILDVPRRDRLQSWLPWILDSRLCLPPCVAFLLSVGASSLKPLDLTPAHSDIQRKAHVSLSSVLSMRRLLPEARGMPAEGSHKLEQEWRAAPETIFLARHCPRVDDGARVREPVVDRQHRTSAHQSLPSNCSQFSDS